MRSKKFLLMLAVTTFFSALATAQTPPPPPKTPGEALQFNLSIAKGEFVSAAEAMPEDKYSFAPTGGEFKGVRTFAQQVKHVAAVNYALASAILAEKSPVDFGDPEKGPDSVKTKAEITKFLTDSFDYLNKAIGSVTEQNALEQIPSVFPVKVARLSLASFSTAHPFDHYGQMVEYLRMNGIVPPASRPRPAPPKK
jgi:uncharacterized damage-inducible protein DinB